MNEISIEKLKFPIGTFQKPDFISENDIKNWIKTIDNFPKLIKEKTENLSFEQLNWTYRPNGWSAKQVVHHCADSHINSFVRFKLALTEENPTIKPYEEASWALLDDGISDDISASLSIIQGVHKRWVLLMKSFTEKELKRTFLHPESKKTFCLEEIIGLYAWHCNHHLAHIDQALEYKGQF
jgi:DinB superfamily